MKRILTATGLILMFSFHGFAQKNPRKFKAPEAKIVMLENGVEAPVKSLQFGKDSHLRVTLQGGVQNFDYKMYVTSTNAVVKEVSKNEFVVIPVTDNKKVELIVDMELYEDYVFYQLKPRGKKRKLKKTLTTYHPDKYMVSYETYAVSK